ncbi:TetR/AcrR family transcriptional regulator [Dictyobacter formicarum]|uniref:TetR family transcriptional regulator n=1 Tax=Dictyobacter formicarum TaxID=2778368 RepID=A0ABQ3VQE1_9CHLR|nr:TetR/AcrR family transcriptional regulator [Dictyobacter formicarum]GHO88487.1 TetR family transcriptional regulator [Dictyobacter formicarum]
MIDCKFSGSLNYMGAYMVRERISRRQRLIEVGVDLFCDQSYEEVAIDDIANAADISKGLLYYYFPTKHDFYIAVVQYAASQLLAATEADPALEPMERLRTSLDAYFVYVERHAKAYISLLRGGVGVDEQVAAIIDMVRQTYMKNILQSFAQDTQSSAISAIAVRGWIGFVEATSIAWLEQRSISRQELCQLAMAAFTLVVHHAQGQQNFHAV